MTEGRPQSLLLERLRDSSPLVTVEIRPPRGGMDPSETIDVWIDLHHSVRRLLKEERFVFVTDNAVGADEEENLAHLAANLGEEVDLRRVVPFLTCKHTLDYCLMYAARAGSARIEALTVLGGGPLCWPTARGPACLSVEGDDSGAGARARVGRLGQPPPLRIGAGGFPGIRVIRGQVLSDPGRVASQSGPGRCPARRKGAPRGGGAGRLRRLPLPERQPDHVGEARRIFPRPAQALTREFGAGATAEEVCARTIRALRDAGADKVFVSNLGWRGAADRLGRILDLV